MTEGYLETVKSFKLSYFKLAVLLIFVIYFTTTVSRILSRWQGSSCFATYKTLTRSRLCEMI